MRRGTVFLDRCRLYARHGVLPQERVVGAWFTVSLWVDCHMDAAVESDSLDGTIDYAVLYHIIEDEMSVPSRLLEHVAGRIARTVFATCPAALQVRVQLVKDNPPFSAALQGAGVDVTFERGE